MLINHYSLHNVLIVASTCRRRERLLGGSKPISMIYDITRGTVHQPKLAHGVAIMNDVSLLHYTNRNCTCFRRYSFDKHDLEAIDKRKSRAPSVPFEWCRQQRDETTNILLASIQRLSHLSLTSMPELRLPFTMPKPIAHIQCNSLLDVRTTYLLRWLNYSTSYSYVTQTSQLVVVEQP